MLVDGEDEVVICLRRFGFGYCSIFVQWNDEQRKEGRKRKTQKKVLIFTLYIEWVLSGYLSHQPEHVNIHSVGGRIEKKN